MSALIQRDTDAGTKQIGTQRLGESPDSPARGGIGSRSRPDESRCRREEWLAPHRSRVAT